MEDDFEITVVGIGQYTGPTALDILASLVPVLSGAALAHSSRTWKIGCVM